MRQAIREKIRQADCDMIDLAGMDITDEEIGGIIQEIGQWHSHVKRVNFSNNKIGDEGAQIICQSLSTLQRLIQIDLQCNRIGKEGLVSLLLLRKTRHGIEFALYGNALTDNECYQLVEKDRGSDQA